LFIIGRRNIVNNPGRNEALAMAARAATEEIRQGQFSPPKFYYEVEEGCGPIIPPRVDPFMLPRELLIPNGQENKMAYLAALQHWMGTTYSAVAAQMPLPAQISGRVSIPLSNPYPVWERGNVAVRWPLVRASAVAVDWGNDDLCQLEQIRRSTGCDISLYEVLNSTFPSLMEYLGMAQYPSELINRFRLEWERMHNRALSYWDEKLLRQATCPNCRNRFTWPPSNLYGWGC
jgi:hypothetical protein